MSNSSNNSVAPWYKQPWLWFILAPLIAVFIYGTFFLYIAITTSDGIVKDDYYKVARGHFVDSSKAQKAIDLAIGGTLQLDNLTGDLMLHFRSNQTEKPALLILDIISPTHQKYDQKITLKRVDGTNAYTGNLKSSLKGKRYILLEAEDATWRLRTESNPPYDQKTIELTASLK
ncbi:FixH family protein [Neptuniibacter halophilus]|uniref:FixH family protein n=1 Tax=Neptuniibacter halophilus TaxID=651666 RepID=UPI00257284DD|nr:FixH family protein [Neptuniibacter halophilus]